MRLLIVGTLEGQLSQATKMAMDGGAKVAHAPGIDIAMAALRTGRGADLLLVDVMMDIAGLIAALEAERIAIPVVACGVETNAAAAVNAIRAGAKEYIPLPPDAELIAAVIAAVARESSDFLYRDPAMERVVRMAEQIAGSEASILITGESGTGKEVVAKYVHARSRRASKAFISVNCAAIPEALLESELFGHEKGAFTDAKERRVGLVEAADGGTLFLDEIGEMDLVLQAKLLKLLEDRSIRRIGAVKERKVDLRVISATNCNLEQMVQQGRFRRDLFFRLRIIALKVPRLYARGQDVLLLARHFLAHHGRRYGKPNLRFSAEAESLMLGYSWPGNVRELRNMLEQTVLLAPNEVVQAHQLNLCMTLIDEPLVQQAAPAVFEMPRHEPEPGTSLPDMERDLVCKTLDRTDWNVTKSARMLGLSRDMLRYRIEKLGLTRPDKRQW